MTTGPGFQVAIGRWLSERFEQVQRWLDPVPEPVLGLLVFAIAAAFVWFTLVDRRRERATPPPPEPVDAGCPQHPQPASKER